MYYNRRWEKLQDQSRTHCRYCSMTARTIDLLAILNDHLGLGIVRQPAEENVRLRSLQVDSEQAASFIGY